MASYPLELKALVVQQPIGVFYVTVIPAHVLLDVAFSDVLSASLPVGADSYELDGTQRLVQPTRIKSIADYINRTDSAFPNSIIIAANYRKEDGMLEDDEPDVDETETEDVRKEEQGKNLPATTKKRWTVHDAGNG